MIKNIFLSFFLYDLKLENFFKIKKIEKNIPNFNEDFSMNVTEPTGIYSQTGNDISLILPNMIVEETKLRNWEKKMVYEVWINLTGITNLKAINDVALNLSELGFSQSYGSIQGVTGQRAFYKLMLKLSDLPSDSNSWWGPIEEIVSFRDVFKTFERGAEIYGQIGFEEKEILLLKLRLYVAGDANYGDNWGTLSFVTGGTLSLIKKEQMTIS